MNVKFLSLTALTAILASSCSQDEVIMTNPDPVGDAITFSSTIGRSRATEITKTNLGDIGIYARGIDANGLYYGDYLIGKQDGNGAWIPEVAKRAADADKWELDRKVYWPTGVNKVLFWSLTAITKDDKNYTSVLKGNGAFSFSHYGPQITGFSPVRQNRTDASSYTDGASQQDLLGAFTPASEKTSNIKLKFLHELAKIDIKAKANEGVTDNKRKVKIKGAWIVNANSKGNFNAKYDFNQGNPTNTPEWTGFTDADKVAYGSLFNDAIELNENAQSILGTNGSLMLIPQAVNAWDKNPKADKYADAKTTDAYILLYCRIEAVHSGTVHSEDGDGNETATSGDGSVGVGDNEHYHQLYPVSDTYNADEYGYSAVPVKIEWTKGKRYTYTLSICGSDSGGGYYPPVLPPDVPQDPDKPVVPDPKKPGDPILDDPISFTVTVEKWDDAWREGQTGDNPYEPKM